MRKLEGRAVICLLLILAMLAGLLFFVVRLEMNGSKWASYYANSHIFKNGSLNAGVVKDRDGDVLLKYSSDGPVYSDTETERRACSQLTGDVKFNITTGANIAFRSRLIGYNFITGTDGILEPIEERSDFEITDQDFSAFVDWYLAFSEKRELLGHTNHLLYICRRLN